MTTRYLCPFCFATISESGDPGSGSEMARVEREIVEHLIDRHPVWRRLHRRIRRALTVQSY